MKRIAVFFGVAAIGIFAITWFVGSAPASDKTALSQVNVPELMKNGHGLADTTPAEPF